MLARHTMELWLRLERAADVGCAEISALELRRWFERDRITSAIWEAIHEKWIEIADEVPLLVGQVGEPASGYVFVWGEGLAPIGGDWSSSGVWLKDVRLYCGRNYNRTPFSLDD